jgi:redox-sensing transcriptional repressor
LLRGSTDTVCPLRAGIENKRHWAWRIADHLESKGAPCQKEGTVPLKTIMRLRWYLTALGELKAKGENVVSSRELAERVGMNSAMVRRDLSFFGELGTPGLGYRVDYLEDQIRGILRRNTCTIVWVGAQSLAGILSMFDAALGLNFKVVAALDSRPEWVGRQIGEWTVRALSDLPDVTSGQTIDGAILALPEDAMHAADVLVEAGIKAILNLTPITLKLPPDVTMHHIDLIGEMMALASEAAPPKTGDG